MNHTTLLTTLCMAALCPAVAAPRPGGQPVGRPGTLRQELAAARKQRLPTSPADLRVETPPAPQNAATYYRAFDRAWRKPGVADSLRDAAALAGRLDLTSTQLGVARNALASHPDLSHLAHQAAACRTCVYKRDWSLGAALAFPEFAMMRNTARWLCLEAAVQLAEGHPLVATATLGLVLRVARQAAADPSLIAWLVGRAIEGLGVRGLATVLYSAGASREAAEAVRTALARPRDPHGVAYALRGDLVVDVASLEMVRKEGPRSLISLLPEGVPRPTIRAGEWNAFVDSNAAYVIWYRRREAAAAALPYRAGQRIRKQLAEDLARRSAARDRQAIIGGVVLGGGHHGPFIEARNRASWECLRAGAALLAVRAAGHGFPGSLSQAVRPVPVDPFDGRPLRYRREGTGFVVYSVGESGHFDGGSPTRKPGPTNSLFRWPRPPYWR